MQSLTRLVYSSESRLVEENRTAELKRMLSTARRLNEDNGITGFLLATTGAFAQVLEGRKETVEETYGRIMLDPRHDNLNLLLDTPIGARIFDKWAMGFADADGTKAFIFGLYGVTPDNDLHRQPLDTVMDLASQFSADHIGK